MKKIAVLFFGVLILFSVCPSSINAQNSHKEIQKKMKNKSIKDARKQAKAYYKDGYRVNPGALPLDKQIEKAWMKEYEEDDYGYPKYIVVPGQAVGQTQSAAKMQALEMAKLELAGKIQTQVAGLVENSIGNQQLNTEEAESVTQTIASSKGLIAQEIGRTITFLEMFRNVNKNVEVRVRIGYNSHLAMQAAREAIGNELKEKTSIAHEKIDKMMDF